MFFKQNKFSLNLVRFWRKALKLNWKQLRIDNRCVNIELAKGEQQGNFLVSLDDVSICFSSKRSTPCNPPQLPNAPGLDGSSIKGLLKICLWLLPKQKKFTNEIQNQSMTNTDLTFTFKEFFNFYVTLLFHVYIENNNKIDINKIDQLKNSMFAKQNLCVNK